MRNKFRHLQTYGADRITMTTLPVEETPLYVILREHEEYGPFCRETLKEAMEMGNLVADDWVRKADRTSCWTSVGQLLYGPPEPESVIIKLRRHLRREVALLVRATERSLSVASRALESCATRLVKRAGLIAVVCIAVATGIAFLPEKPLVILVPWILAGIAAGVAMTLRRKVFRGIIACLAASILPLAANRANPVVARYLDPDRRENALPPIGEMYSTMPRKSADLHKDRLLPAKSGIPALGLPEPTEDGK